MKNNNAGKLKSIISNIINLIPFIFLLHVCTEWIGGNQLVGFGIGIFFLIFTIPIFIAQMIGIFAIIEFKYSKKTPTTSRIMLNKCNWFFLIFYGIIYLIFGILLVTT